MAEARGAPAPSSLVRWVDQTGGSIGAALPLVILLLLALTVLTHGVFLLALEEGAASRASAALLQARVLSEAGVRKVLEDLRDDTLPLVEGTPVAHGEVPGGRFEVELRRLGREVLWVEGRGAAALVPGGPARVEDRAARLLWALSPLERVGAFGAAIEHGGVMQLASGGGMEAWSAGEAGNLDAPRGCRDRRAALDSVLPSGFLLPSASVTFGADGRLPRLGLLGGDSLLARVTPRVTGTVSPSPVLKEGICVLDAAGNWGSPSLPGGPCGGHRPAIAAEEDLRVDGGQGQGLLLVGGNLLLGGGALYEGLVLVGGDLTLEDGSVLRGLVRVRGSVSISGGAHLSGRLCPALLALEAARSLRRPLTVPGGGWVRPL